MSNVTQFSSLQGQCMDVKSDVSQTSEASSLSSSNVIQPTPVKRSVFVVIVCFT